MRTAVARHGAGILLVLVALVGLGVRLGPGLARPFDLDVSGFNGAVWTTGSRALRHDAIGSRLGARAPVRGADATYVDHPPGLVWTLAAAEAVGGEHPVVDRAPVVLAGVAAVLATYLLLVSLGIAPLAAGAGILLASWSSMAVGFSSMVDTWILGLGPAAAFLAVRAGSGPKGRGRTALLLAVTAATVVTSWQGWILVGVATVVDVVAPGRAERRRDLALVVGAAAFAALATALWVLWGAGPGGLSAAFAARTGTGGDHLFSSWPSSQLRRLRDYGGVIPLLTGSIGLVLCLRRPPFLRALAPPVVTVATWSLVFWEGAEIHDYWLYWSLLPIAAGTAVAVDVVVRWRPAPQRTAVLALAIVMLAAVGLRPVSGTELARRVTQAGGDDLAGARWSPTGATTYLLDATIIGEEPLAAYYSHRPTVRLHEADLGPDGGADPEADVVVHVDAGGARCLATGAGDRLVVRPLRSVASMPTEAPGSCQADRIAAIRGAR